MNRKYTNEQIEWIKQNYPLYDRCTIAKLFEETFNQKINPCSITTVAYYYGFKSGRTGQFKKKYPQEYYDWLQQHSEENTIKLVPKFNEHFNTNLDYHVIKALINNHIKRPDTYDCRKYAKEGSRRKQLYSESTNVSGIRIKVDDNKWVYKSRYIWEQHNGPIPENHIIIHLDGDNTNCNINNLDCIPRGILGPLNKHYSYKGIKETTQAGIEILRTERLIKEEIDNA